MAKTLLDKIEEYDFECIGGPLANCTDWEQLKSACDLWIVVKYWGGAESIIMHTGGRGGWRYLVHTNKAEAQATADEINRKSFGNNQVCTVRHLLDRHHG